jgi:hypothetical protein
VRDVDDPGRMLDTFLECDVGKVELLKLSLRRLTSAAGGSSEVTLQQISRQLLRCDTEAAVYCTQPTPLGSTIHKLGPPSSSTPPMMDATPKGRTLE